LQMTKTLRIASLHGSIDFVIITIRSDEFKAVRDRFSPSIPVFDGRQHYEYFQLHKADGSIVNLAMVRSFGQGHTTAVLVTQYAIEDLAPKWIVLTGIAGAVPDSEFTLGDVLLADSVHDFSITAVIYEKPTQHRMGGGSMHPAVERLLAGLPARQDDLGDWNDLSQLGLDKPRVCVPDNIDDECFYGLPDEKASIRDLLKSTSARLIMCGSLNSTQERPPHPIRS
jgi:nucleoside phosphorylase